MLIPHGNHQHTIDDNAEELVLVALWVFSNVKLIPTL